MSVRRQPSTVCRAPRRNLDAVLAVGTTHLFPAPTSTDIGIRRSQVLDTHPFRAPPPTDIGIRRSQVLQNTSFYGEELAMFLVTGEEDATDNVRDIQQIIVRTLRVNVSTAALAAKKSLVDALLEKTFGENNTRVFNKVSNEETHTILNAALDCGDKWKQLATSQVVEKERWHPDVSYMDRLQTASIPLAPNQPFACEVFVWAAPVCSKEYRTMFPHFFTPDGTYAPAIPGGVPPSPQLPSVLPPPQLPSVLPPPPPSGRIPPPRPPPPDVVTPRHNPPSKSNEPSSKQTFTRNGEQHGPTLDQLKEGRSNLKRVEKKSPDPVKEGTGLMAELLTAIRKRKVDKGIPDSEGPDADALFIPAIWVHATLLMTHDIALEQM